MRRFLKRKKKQPEYSLPEDFDAKKYLQLNPDVDKSIKSGKIESAEVHFVQYGRNEGRKYVAGANELGLDFSVSQDLPEDRLEEGLVLTCDPSKLYPLGGFSGGSALFERLRLRQSLRTTILAEVFPPWQARRPPPNFLGGWDAKDQIALTDHHNAIELDHKVGPAAQLCISQDIELAGGTLYYIENNDIKILHETFRPCDRHAKAVPRSNNLMGYEVFSDDSTYFLLDSFGSFNYGHFLVEDLPRLIALDFLPKDGRLVTILMTRYNSVINDTRRKAVELMLNGRINFSILFLDRNRHYRFKNLLHVTPSAETAVLMSPESLNELAARMHRRTQYHRAKMRTKRLAQGRWRRPKLFVDRNPAHGRELVNREAILSLVQSRGYEIFVPESVHIGQQAAIFAEASLVVGTMGAGMANTMFCAPGTPLLYFVPNEWKDPFYWNIAAGRNHPYAIISGPRLPTSAEWYLQPFHIEATALVAALEKIEAMAEIR